MRFISLKRLVGERGFEPPTPWSRTRCSTRLSHSPTSALLYSFQVLAFSLFHPFSTSSQRHMQPPIREARLLAHLLDGRLQLRELHPSFSITHCSGSLSRLGSATLAQTRVLIPQLLRFLRLAHVHAAVLRLPGVDRVLRYSHFSRHVFGLCVRPPVVSAPRSSLLPCACSSPSPFPFSFVRDHTRTCAERRDQVKEGAPHVSRRSRHEYYRPSPMRFSNFQF